MPGDTPTPKASPHPVFKPFNRSEKTSRGRILVVEDDAASRTALKFLLGRDGWTVACVATVAQAIEQLSQQGPDFILLDLMLPDGDGTVVLQALADRRLSSRVIVTTGVIDTAWLARVEAFRPFRILRKPIDMNALFSSLA